jgi:hypothetical protein
MQELITSSEARKLLGDMAPSSFKVLVDSKRVRKVVPPGRTQGKYLREDVEKLAAELLPFMEEKAPKHPDQPKTNWRDNASKKGATDWAKASDLPYMLAYDYEMYGVENTVDISITHKWWEKNPYMARLLFNADDRREIWGGVTIMPMEEETIIRVLKDELLEKDIQPEHVLTYETGKKYYGYVASATVKKEHSVHFRELLQSVFDFWCEKYPDIQLIKLYAYASSLDGWDMIKRLFFTPRKDIDFNAFELDPYERNPSHYLKAFHQCLQAKGVAIRVPIL